MRALCEEKGVEFILVKAPTNNWKYYWYDEWEAQIVAWAGEKNVEYYNFIPLDTEIGIDWNTDTYDGGVHLNVYGAEKLTSYFGRILVEKYGFSDRRGNAELDAIWSKKLEIYQKERNGENQ